MYRALYIGAGCLNHGPNPGENRSDSSRSTEIIMKFDDHDIYIYIYIMYIYMYDVYTTSTHLVGIKYDTFISLIYPRVPKSPNRRIFGSNERLFRLMDG